MYFLDITSGEHSSESFLNLEADVPKGEVAIYDSKGREVMRDLFSRKWGISLKDFTKGKYQVELFQDKRSVMKAGFLKR